MADGFLPIPRSIPGGVSLVSSAFANQLIDLINAMGGGIVAPTAGVGSFKLAGGQYVLDIGPMDARLRAVEGRALLPPLGATGDALVKTSANNGATNWSNVVTVSAIQNILSSLSNIQSDVSALQATAVATTSNVSALQATAAATTSNVSALQTSVSAQNTAINNLNANMSTQQNTTTATTARLDAASITASCSNGNVTVTLSL